MLFKGEMVRAILRDESPKTQTRRIINPQIPEGFSPGFLQATQRCEYQTQGGVLVNPCPYGIIGDRIWVKETFAADTESIKGYVTYQYKADEYKRWFGRWKPSIFCTRDASRINLEITKIRVERLQDISEADAIAEGIERKADGWKDYRKGYAGAGKCDAIGSYRSLWNSINSKPNPVYARESALTCPHCEMVHEGDDAADALIDSPKEGHAVCKNCQQRWKFKGGELGKKKIVSYVTYPWSEADFEALYPGVIASGQYRGKPIVVTANPWVWVVEFKKVNQ